MVQSMTGFASTTITLTTPSGAVPATLTIKTLNNRFFDMNCKLPYALSHLEPEMIKIGKKYLHRGTAYCSLYISNPHALKAEVFPSLALAQGYMKAIASMQETLKIPGTLTISDFITLPHLFEAAEEANIANNGTLVMTALEELLKILVATRVKEGAALAKDLETRMAIIGEQVTLIEPRAAAVSAQRKEAFLQELAPLLERATQEVRDAHLQALYTTLDKIDVNEEIVRFKNHHTTFLQTLHDGQEQKGKKLDFILQEMFREINTLNAKLPDAFASGPIITIKVELEKAREQVQNLV